MNHLYSRLSEVLDVTLVVAASLFGGPVTAYRRATEWKVLQLFKFPEPIRLRRGMHNLSKMPVKPHQMKSIEKQTSSKLVKFRRLGLWFTINLSLSLSPVYGQEHLGFEDT